MLPRFILTVLTACISLTTVSGRYVRKDELKSRQREAVKRWQGPSAASHLTKRAQVKNITFSNPKASRWSC